MKDNLLMGIDGCKSGWIAACVTSECRQPFLRFSQTLLGIFELGVPTIAAIDMPLVLPSIAMAGGRPTDRHARRILGRRASCVFSPPCSKALNSKTFTEACAVNRDSSPDGIGLSRQAFAIFPKMNEVASFLRSFPGARRFAREIHPEVSFAFMNSKAPIPTKKKRSSGREARMNLIDEAYGKVSKNLILEGKKYGASADDVLDALAALWSAERIAFAKAYRVIDDGVECGDLEVIWA